MLRYEAIQDQTSIQITFLGKCQALYLSEIESSFTSEFSVWLKNQKKLFLDTEQLTAFDTAGAWLIARCITQAKQAGLSVDLKASDQQRQQINHLLTLKKQPPEQEKELNVFQSFFQAIGFQTISFFWLAKDLVTFLGEVVALLFGTLAKKQPARGTSIVHHIDVVGFRALPIVGLISFLIGAVLAYQGINQLSKFGAQVYTVDFLAVSILREIAVLITAIVVAGRTGSSFAAQIGTMALNQEIDAIKVLGLNPIVVLVIPRVIALLIALPLLVFFAVIMGLVGGMVITYLIIDLSPLQFWTSFQKALSPTTFWVGMSKSPLFAIIIALVGCFRGLQVKGSAESVGFMTTRSVVESIFIIIVCDALLSILFSSLDI